MDINDVIDCTLYHPQIQPLHNFGTLSEADIEKLIMFLKTDLQCLAPYQHHKLKNWLIYL